jgi:hypothetical protein
MYTLYYLLFKTVYIKIVQHVSNYVTVHLQGLNCLLHQLFYVIKKNVRYK